jgi:hypothetical protein
MTLIWIAGTKRTLVVLLAMFIGSMTAAFVPKQLSPRSPSSVVQHVTYCIEPPKTAPLPPHTFAGMIENGIRSRFGREADRVIESLRLREQDYEHNAFVGGADRDPETSNCRQFCNSFVPGLSILEFWSTGDFEWVQKLKSKYKVIWDEFQKVTSDMELLKTQGNNIWAGALTQDAGSYGEGAFIFHACGHAAGLGLGYADSCFNSARDYCWKGSSRHQV